MVAINRLKPGCLDMPSFGHTGLDSYSLDSRKFIRQIFPGKTVFCNNKYRIFVHRSIPTYSMGRYLKPLTLAGEQRLSQPPYQAQPSDSNPVWVKLVVVPSAYSHDSALLLCRYSDDEWVAWIPDHGEAILHVSEFYFGSTWN